jgi:phosphocarrier protein
MQGAAIDATPRTSSSRRRPRMQIREIPVTLPLGLHARASARVVALAQRFRADIWLVVAGRRASARSIVAVMMLAAAVGSVVRIEASGPDEQAAVEAMVQLLDAGAAATPRLLG